MDVLFLLLPMSVVLVLAILAVFAWALHTGQFDDLEQQAALNLDGERDSLDVNQGR